MSLTRTQPTFYYDLGSPYAYLAAERVNALFDPPPLWQPILLGGIFKLTGRQSWSLTDQREQGMAEIERRADLYGLPSIRWPVPWPGNTLFAMRAATFAASLGRAVAFSLAAFRQAFAGGHDLTDPEVVLIAAAAAELHPRAVTTGAASKNIKESLLQATETAASLGVVGVPTVAVADQLFFGDDQLELAAAAVTANR